MTQFSDDHLSTACRFDLHSRCFGNAGAGGRLSGEACACSCHPQRAEGEDSDDA